MHSTTFSLEVFPPKRDTPVGTIYDTLDGLQGVNPDFISVTFGTGKETDQTITARIAHTIKSEYDIPAVAHLTALYANQADIDVELELFEKAGVSAVLALGGNVLPDREPAHVFEYASDLVNYIREHKPNLEVFAACYPECHPTANNMDEDIEHLKIKVDAGADRLISQLFFDNTDFLHFIDQARCAGITVPIEAGIMPVTSASQIRRMVSMCGSKIPPRLAKLLDRWGSDREALREAGIVYASEQISDLVADGVDGIHLYTMNHAGTTRRIWNNTHILFER
ncbi:MAG: methylenetetrahydrofolate reductase [NAD(P)H] [Bifidobacterium sp.]|nr:methylenetetrahydrofolate reductase [NAD(P)H] [Bifidobacterium sp.]MCH4174387.1 methylenetetrahydrofolate reductase [NAD(P)H] [Bifidobacterium sp.]